MPTHQVNMDALIKRADFEGATGTEGLGGPEPILKIEELASDRIYFSVLRKPDFQRTTNNWSAEMIVDFVESFLDGCVIPAIILWHSKQTNTVFVVDGSHRLGALIAWVNDDYGAGSISRAYYNNDIGSAELKFHDKTKMLMDSRVGTFSELKRLALNALPTDDPIKVKRGRAIALLVPYVQKVQGTAKDAELSFFKINSNPATIDSNELDILQARDKPNAIATRAIMRAGTSYFPNVAKAREINSLAKEVYEIIFGPVSEISSTSPDVPRAGQPYSNEAFKMVLDLVNEFNGVTPAMWKSKALARRAKKKKKDEDVKELEADKDGSATITYLNCLKDIGTLVVDNGEKCSGSLGLDPAVYCYGEKGKFHPYALIASMKFAQWLKGCGTPKLIQFTDQREKFEDFLVAHKSFITQLGHIKGSRTRPVESMVMMYREVLDCLVSETYDHPSIVEKIKAHIELQELRTESNQVDSEEQPKKKFPKSVQNAAVVKQILENREKCKECNARMPPACRSKDHVVRQQDSGKGIEENLAFTHPFCNTGYKEYKHAKKE